MILPRSFRSLLAKFILLFEPISPRFVSFLIGGKLKEWKNKGLIEYYKTKTKRTGKFHYKIYLDLGLTPEQASRIVRDPLIKALKRIRR
jgi:hypothetical protein